MVGDVFCQYEHLKKIIDITLFRASFLVLPELYLYDITVMLLNYEDTEETTECRDLVKCNIHSKIMMLTKYRCTNGKLIIIIIFISSPITNVYKHTSSVDYIQNGQYNFF